MPKCIIRIVRFSSVFWHFWGFFGKTRRKTYNTNKVRQKLKIEIDFSIFGAPYSYCTFFDFFGGSLIALPLGRWFAPRIRRGAAPSLAIRPRLSFSALSARPFKGRALNAHGAAKGGAAVPFSVIFGGGGFGVKMAHFGLLEEGWWGFSGVFDPRAIRGFTIFLENRQKWRFSRS